MSSRVRSIKELTDIKKGKLYLVRNITDKNKPNILHIVNRVGQDFKNRNVNVLGCGKIDNYFMFAGRTQFEYAIKQKDLDSDQQGITFCARCGTISDFENALLESEYNDEIWQRNRDAEEKIRSDELKRKWDAQQLALKNFSDVIGSKINPDTGNATLKTKDGKFEFTITCEEIK